MCIQRTARRTVCSTLIFCISIFLISNPPVTAHAEQILRYDNGAEPEYIDPTMISDTASDPIALNIFEGLVTPDPKTLEPRPGVAERWEISPDGKTYTFYLRKNAHWTDGKSVTAHDFVYAWRRAADPATATRQASRLYYVKNGQSINEGKIKDLNQLGVKATDDYTLVATLENPFPPFLELLTYSTYFPVRKDVVEKFGTQWTRPEHIVSNGPFSLVEWIPQKDILVKKNPTYWDASVVKLDGAYFYPVEDVTTAVKMFLSKQLDWAEAIPMSQLGAVRNRPEFDMSEHFAIYYFEINVKKPPLNDPRVRKALAMAIDRETLCKVYLQGTCRPATYWMIPPGVKGYPYFPGYSYNPAEAKKLLAEAGYADPSKFPAFELIYNTNESHKLIAEVIQQMWKTNLGINVTVQNMEWKSLLKQLKEHQFTVSRFGGVGEYTYPTTFLETFLTNASGNHAQWSNPRYDAMWKEANATADSAKRLQLYAEMEKMLRDDCASIPLYYYLFTTMLQPNIKGFHRNLMNQHPLKWVSIEGAAAQPGLWQRLHATPRPPVVTGGGSS